MFERFAEKLATGKGAIMTIRQEKNQGMNWIRQEKRLAIYLRDGCACVWCGATVESGAQLTLDHVVGHAKTQNNSETNLVTACHRCNTSRGTRSAAKFSGIVAAYLNHGVVGAEILKGVRRAQSRVLKPFLAEAKELVSRRGSAFAALQERN